MIICSRCGAEVGAILDHYDEHHGMPVAKVRDYRVFLDFDSPSSEAAQRRKRDALGRFARAS